MTPGVALPSRAVESRVVSTSWGVSITLVLAICAGVYAQAEFAATLRERAASLEAIMANHSASFTRLEAGMQNVANELRDLRIENAQFRERLSKVEAALERR